MSGLKMRYGINELSDCDQVTIFVGGIDVKIRVTDQDELEIDVSAPGEIETGVFRVDEDGDAPVRFRRDGADQLGIMLRPGKTPRVPGITAALVRELHEADYQHPAVISRHENGSYRVEAEPTAQSYGRKVVASQGQVEDWSGGQEMSEADYEQFARELQTEVDEREDA